jgi:hypothetical protein
LGCEADLSPPSSAKVKNEWSYTSTHSICHHGIQIKQLLCVIKGSHSGAVNASSLLGCDTMQMAQCHIPEDVDFHCY